MIDTFIVLRAVPTIHSDILTNIDPIQTEDKLDVLSQFIQFQNLGVDIVTRDDSSGTLSMVSQEPLAYDDEPPMTSAPRKTSRLIAKRFSKISYLIDLLFVFKINENQETVNLDVMDLTDSIERIDSLNGAIGARGYDIAERAEKEYDLDIDWDWEKLEKTYHVATAI